MSQETDYAKEKIEKAYQHFSVDLSKAFKTNFDLYEYALSLRGKGDDVIVAFYEWIFVQCRTSSCTKRDIHYFNRCFELIAPDPTERKRLIALGELVVELGI